MTTTINLAQINNSTIRPGYLVSLKTTITGGVSYKSRVLQSEQVDANGTLTAKWETDKTVIDAAEHDAAVKARQKSRSSITSNCINTTFGLLCPDADYPNFEAGVKAAREIAEQFNATSQYTRLNIHVIVGRIAQDDVSAMQALGTEAADLLEQMQQGLAELDVKKVREAANQAKNLGGMLSVEAQAKVMVAVETARKAARQMVSEAADNVKLTVDKVAIRKIEEQRNSFLDLSEAVDVAAPVEDVAPALDLSPDGTDIEQVA